MYIFATQPRSVYILAQVSIGLECAVDVHTLNNLALALYTTLTPGSIIQYPISTELQAHATEVCARRATSAPRSWRSSSWTPSAGIRCQPPRAPLLLRIELELIVSRQDCGCIKQDSGVLQRLHTLRGGASLGTTSEACFRY